MDPNADQPADVLIVDDDRTIRETLVRALAQAGLVARVAAGIEEARHAIDGVRSVLLDIRLRDGDGLAFLTELRASHPKLPVVMATAYGDSSRTILAMKQGAFDYLTKPFDIDLMVATLRRAIKVPVAAATPAGETSGTALIGSSARMIDVWKSIGRAAANDVPVLITGESGTGKELVARAIHDHGARKDAPFVAVNIAALAPSLVESELFGHEKGAFTGATERRAGRFEVAHGGTLFLDEVGDLEMRFSDQATPSAPGRQLRARGRDHATTIERARRRRDLEAGPARGRGTDATRGPVLSAGRVADRAPTVAREAQRYPAARRSVLATYRW
ncbi:MAG TPA: sigma 54-interacting transcriptional regulator [Kofleriaceae bacterium]